MYSLDMAGSDEWLEVAFETHENQTPYWAVQDAFEMGRKLKTKALRYPLHFETINTLSEDGAGSDHMPFINAGIPALAFVSGTNLTPIHTAMDRIEFITPDMLDRYGIFVDALLVKYDREGIPSQSGDGYLLLFSSWPASLPLISAFNYAALILGLWAFLISRKSRMQIPKANRVRFSGLNDFWDSPFSLLILAQSGETVMGLILSLKNPWFAHPKPYLVLALFWLIAGLWICLQITKKWRFSPDPYVYVKRALIVPLLFMIGALITGPRLALYPALTLLFMGLTFMLAWGWAKVLFSLLAPIPTLLLMFHEYYSFITRIMASMQVDPMMSLIMSLIRSAVLFVFYVAFLYLYAFLAVTLPSVKPFLKEFRLIKTLPVILIFICGYSVFLYTLPAYTDMWRPSIRIEGKYDQSTQKSHLNIVSNENMKNVIVNADSISIKLDGQSTDSLAIRFQADWSHLFWSDGF